MGTHHWAYLYNILIRQAKQAPHKWVSFELLVHYKLYIDVQIQCMSASEDMCLYLKDMCLLPEHTCLSPRMHVLPLRHCFKVFHLTTWACMSNRLNVSKYMRKQSYSSNDMFYRVKIFHSKLTEVLNFFCGLPNEL